MMDRKMSQALDRHITGNWGEDQFREVEEDEQEEINMEVKKLESGKFSDARKAAEAEKAKLEAKKMEDKKDVKSGEAKEAKAKAPKAKKEPSQGLTVGQTKIGITLVLSKEDCKSMGFKDSDSSKAVRDHARKKLGLN